MVLSCHRDAEDERRSAAVSWGSASRTSATIPKFAKRKMNASGSRLTPARRVASGPAGDDHVGIRQAHVGGARLPVDDLHAEVGGLQCDLHRFDTSLPWRGVQFEHTGSHGRHLGAGFGAHAGGEHATRHRRADLMQEGVEVSAATRPGRHDEVGAVGGEPGVEHRSDSGRQVAPGRRRPEQHGRRVVDACELGDDPGVRTALGLGVRPAHPGPPARAGALDTALVGDCQRHPQSRACVLRPMVSGDDGLRG